MSKDTQKLTQGQCIDPLTLNDIHDRSISIPDAQLNTLLIFRRFAGCPVCNLHIQALSKHMDRFIEKGLQIVVVFESSQQKFSQQLANSPFHLVADKPGKLYRKFNVQRSIRSIAHPASWFSAAKGAVKHGVGLTQHVSSEFILPAEFMIDPRGRLLAVHYGKHANDQWSADDIVALLP